jgi:hypothetical protein
MGFLLLWLRVDCGGNAAVHRDIHKQWALDPMQKYGERLTLRDEAMASTDTVMVACFKKERPARGDESSGEPRTLV